MSFSSQTIKQEPLIGILQPLIRRFLPQGTGTSASNITLSLDGNLRAYTTAVGYVSTNSYGREHVYEMQLR